MEDARGIYASSRLFFDGEAGNVSITNIGDLTTSGGDADGIYALSEVRSFFSTTGNATSGAVTVMQTGDITVSEAGQSNDGFPYGIKARSRVTLLTGTGNTISTGPVTVTHRGNITITGDRNVEAIRAASVVRSVGVVTQVSTAAAVTVEHTYDIVSDGQGIVALSDAGRANSSATAGAVTVTQNGKITTASGIGIEAKANAVSSAGTAKAGAVTVTQTGDISTNGDSTGGIYAWSFAETTNGTATSGPVTVTQTGTITTSGRESHGIQARTDGGGNVTVVHKGKITVTGQGANGIGAALRDGGDAFVSTAGRDGQPGDQIYSKYGNAIFVSTGSGNASLEIANQLTGGAVSSGGGNTVAVDLTRVNGTSRVELQEGFGFNGIVDARNNGNTQPVGNNLVFGGDGTNNFDLSQISLDLTEDAGEVFFGFDTFGVESGTWSFSGATDADFTVSGGTLGGNGTFGGLNFTGGTLAPGDSIGAITVNGAFSMAAASTFEVEVDAAGNNDKVIVNGTVNLTGATLTVLAEPGDYADETNYTIIENDGTDAVSGSFGQVSVNSAFLTPSVDYAGGTGNDVVLTLEGVPFTTAVTRSIPSGPGTKNQLAVARALDQFPTDNALFGAIFRLPSFAEAR
ncbi:MAG: hypothetical protein AAF967_06240, partial [Pseudomonadota bacterium]